MMRRKVHREEGKLLELQGGGREDGLLQVLRGGQAEGRGDGAEGRGFLFLQYPNSIHINVRLGCLVTSRPEIH